MMDSTTNSLRQKARRWTWFCPGAGYAMMGRGEQACVALAISAVTAICALSFPLNPNATTLKLFVTAFAVACISWSIEYVAVGRVETLQNPVPWWSRFGKLALAISCGLGVAIVVCFVLKVGYMRLRGSGMSPTLLPGERFLFSKNPSKHNLAPGRLVIFKTSTDSAWGQGRDVVIARILAIPADAIAIKDGHYVVNGRPGSEVAATGKFRPVVAIPTAPGTVTIPADSYFVVQDSPNQSYDSRVLSWAKTDKIIGTRPLLISLRAFGKPLD